MRSSLSISSPSSTSSASSRTLYSWLSLLYCCTALLIKLSAIALLVLPLFIMADAIKRRYKRLCLLGLFTGLLLLLSLLGRNYISSGYLLYPSTIPDIFTADWKMPAPAVRDFKHYISIYARLPTNLEKSLTQSYIPFSQWMPEWWGHIGWINQWLIGIILASVVLVPVFVFFTGKKHPVLQKGKYAVVFCGAFAGSLLWLLTAPDPRFGIAFLIPLFYVLVQPWMGTTRRAGTDRLTSRLYLGMTGILLATLIGYSAYRFVYFFNPRELVCPSGIVKDAFEPLECETLSIDLTGNKLSPTAPDNLTPTFTPKSPDNLPPKSQDSACPYTPRGKTVAEGFRP